MNKREGGVLMYIVNNISAIEINKESKPAYELVYVKLKRNKKHVIIPTIYRPPKTSPDNDEWLYNERRPLYVEILIYHLLTGKL